MRSYYYYLSNVRHDSFTLEVPYLLPSDHGCRDLSNCTVVTIFDVRVRPLSSIASHIMRRRRGAAATIAAWSIRDNRSSSGEKKCKTEFIELGRATFVEEQDYILIQDLIKRANGLVLLMTSAALKKSKFRASLYYEEEEEDDDSIIDITFSNYNHKDDQFGSEIEDNDYHLLLNDDDNNNNNPPLDNNKNIDAILADLAVNTSRLFSSKQEKT